MLGAWGGWKEQEQGPRGSEGRWAHRGHHRGLSDFLSVFFLVTFPVDYGLVGIGSLVGGVLEGSHGRRERQDFG